MHNNQPTLPQMKCTVDEKEVSFREFLVEMGGGTLTSLIYESDIRDILYSWKKADYAFVDDYIAPLAAQIIIDTFEINKELYSKIMTLILDAYHDNRSHLVPRPSLTLVKSERSVTHGND